MIVRVWRGYASAANPGAYPEHFRRSVLPALAKLDSFLGAQLLRRDAPEGLEILVLTRWRSMAAIRAFAGDQVERAVVEPEAAAALVRYDETVRHYEVVEE